VDNGHPTVAKENPLSKRMQRAAATLSARANKVIE
jgi:hypothetical protein